MHISFYLKSEFAKFAPHRLNESAPLQKLAGLFNAYGAKPSDNSRLKSLVEKLDPALVGQMESYYRGRISIELNDKAPVSLVEQFVDSLGSAELEDVIDQKTIELHYREPVQRNKIDRPGKGARIS